jgi:hypothetical protein
MRELLALFVCCIIILIGSYLPEYITLHERQVWFVGLMTGIFSLGLPLLILNKKEK